MQTPQGGRARAQSLQGTSSPPAVDVYDAMEREQEGLVNKLQREITALRRETRVSRSPSVSSNASSRSTSSSRQPAAALMPEGRPRHSVGEHDAMQSLRRENDALRRQVAKLTAQLADKEALLSGKDATITAPVSG